MSYGSDLNNRLMLSFFDSCSKVSHPIQNNGVDLIRELIVKEMTPLDKFYVFINPNQSSSEFKWCDRIISQVTKTFRGKAREIIENNFDEILKTLNQEMISESYHQFNTFESILDFVQNNDQLLDLLSKDTEFYLRFSDKLDQLIAVTDARERVLDVTNRFFSKLTHSVQGQGWKTDAERAREIKSEIISRMTGKLNLDEVKALFMRKEHLKSFEEMRLFINLKKITYHLVDEQGDHKDLEIHYGDEVKSTIIDELKEYYKAMWQGIYEGGKFGESLEVVSSDKKFFIFYDSIKRHLSDNIEVLDICLRAILENANGEEIDQFLTCLNRMMNRSWVKTAKDLEMGQQILRAIPLIKYLTYRKGEPRIALELKFQEARIAALLFVQSIKANNLSGIALAKNVMRKYISAENLIYQERHFRDKAPIEQENLTSRKSSIFPEVEKKFVKYISDFLNSEELPLFMANYNQIYHEISSAEASTSGANSSEPVIKLSNEGVEFFTKSPSFILHTLAGNKINLEGHILNPYDKRFEEFSYINDLKERDKEQVLKEISEKIYSIVINENRHISPDEILKFVEQSTDSLLLYQRALPSHESTLRLKIFIQIALRKFEETSMFPTMHSYYVESKELLAQFEKGIQVADDSTLLNYFQNVIDPVQLYNRSPLPVEIQNAFKTMTEERLYFLLNHNLLNLEKWTNISSTTLLGDLKTVLVEYLSDLLPSQELKNQMLNTIFTLLKPEEVVSLIFWLVRPELANIIKAIEVKSINVSLVVDKILEYYRSSEDKYILDSMLKDRPRNKHRIILGNILCQYVNDAKSQTENFFIAKSLIEKYSLANKEPSKEILTDEQIDELLAEMDPWEPPFSLFNEEPEWERELNLRMSLLRAPQIPKDEIPTDEKTKNPKIFE